MYFEERRRCFNSTGVIEWRKLHHCWSESLSHARFRDITCVTLMLHLPFLRSAGCYVQMALENVLRTRKNSFLPHKKEGLAPGVSLVVHKISLKIQNALSTFRLGSTTQPSLPAAVLIPATDCLKPIYSVEDKVVLTIGFLEIVCVPHLFLRDTQERVGGALRTFRQTPKYSSVERPGMGW